MTELSPVGTFSPDNKNKAGSVGPLAPNTIGKIVSVKNGELLPPGEENVGELCLAGPQVMLGYYGNEEATKATVVDGWLKTGDIAYADDEGYFFVVDRIKELIKVKGFQVAPGK